MPNINSILQLQPFFNTLSNLKCQKPTSVKIEKKDTILKEASTSPISKSRSAPDLYTLLAISSLTHSNTSKSTMEQIELILETDFLESCIQ